MHTTMVSAQFFVYFFVFAVNYAALSEGSCRQFRRKTNVTIHTDHCQWENYTEPTGKRFCLESCFTNPTVRDQIKVKAKVTAENKNVINVKKSKISK